MYLYNEQHTIQVYHTCKCVSEIYHASCKLDDCFGFFIYNLEFFVLKSTLFCFMLEYTTRCQRLNATPTLYIVFRSHPSFSFGFQFRSLPFCTGEACYLSAWLIIQTTKNRVCVIFLQKYYWSILFSSIKIDHSMTKKTLSSSKQHLSVKREQAGFLLLLMSSWKNEK